MHWYGWVLGISLNLILVGILVMLGRRRSAQGSGREYRAAAFGVAAGSTFGLTAALMKGMTKTFSDGIVTLLTSWEIFAMVAAGLLGMFLVQSALNAEPPDRRPARPDPSRPGHPGAWGVLAFHEEVPSAAGTSCPR